MQLILFHLPSIIARLPTKINNLLDFGSGPTIYVAICFREKAENIFLSDYLPQNKKELNNWLSGNSNFDWTKIFKVRREEFKYLKIFFLMGLPECLLTLND